MENDYHDYLINNPDFTWVMDGSVDGVYEFTWTVPDTLPYIDPAADWFDIQVRVNDAEEWRGFLIFHGDVAVLSGQVLDAITLEPIAYAEIELWKEEWGIFTEADEQGYYSILVPQGAYHLVCKGFEGSPYSPGMVDIEITSDTIHDMHLQGMPEEFTLEFKSKEKDGPTADLGTIDLGEGPKNLPLVIQISKDISPPEEPVYIPAEGYEMINVKDVWNPETNTLTIIFIYKLQPPTVNTPPEEPSSPSPIDGAVDVSVDSVLGWVCSDPDQDSLTYQVFFGTSSDPPSVAQGLTVATFNPGTLSYSTTYYWKIVADDAVDQTVGSVWSFTTEAQQVSPSEWSVSLDVTVGGFEAEASFGVKEGATAGFDSGAGDALASPAPPTGVSAYFWHPDNTASPVDFRKLSTSLLPVEYPAEWTLKVKTIGVSGEATVMWSSSEIYAIPSDYSVTLETASGGVDMRSAGSYVWTADEDMVYTFTITITIGE